MAIIGLAIATGINYFIFVNIYGMTIWSIVIAWFFGGFIIPSALLYFFVFREKLPYGIGEDYLDMFFTQELAQMVLMVFITQLILYLIPMVDSEEE